ncbi:MULTISPECIES: acyl carrier protein [Paenibacillus]|uniref:acyl carrier protein n=1 Tax=Paenibacillus TaxID=44249 RepID=UPI001F163161|nr:MULTISPECIES: acyl carrier protein [Paenibacillus]
MALIQDNIEIRVGQFIADNAGMDEIDRDLRVFEEGIVNSLFAIELMTYLEKEFSIKIRIDDLNMQNFASVNTITEFVTRKLDELKHG